MSSIKQPSTEVNLCITGYYENNYLINIINNDPYVKQFSGKKGLDKFKGYRESQKEKKANKESGIEIEIKKINPQTGEKSRQIFDLTNCEFKITQLNAPVVLENFNIPPQEADITTGVQVDSGIMVTTGMGPGNTTTPGRLTNITPGTSDVLTKNIRVDKNGGETGILNSTGYVYIGRDPYTQSGFDVEDADGQREFTTVKLFREDIEDLL